MTCTTQLKTVKWRKYASTGTGHPSKNKKTAQGGCQEFPSNRVSFWQVTKISCIRHMSGLWGREACGNPGIEVWREVWTGPNASQCWHEAFRKRNVIFHHDNDPKLYPNKIRNGFTRKRLKFWNSRARARARAEFGDLKRAVSDTCGSLQRRVGKYPRIAKMCLALVMVGQFIYFSITLYWLFIKSKIVRLKNLSGY